MINLTSRYYANVSFLPVATTAIQNQINTQNTTGINRLNFVMKSRRQNVGIAPDISGSQMSQIDVLINPNATYAFPNLQTAQTYALQAANETVNNASYYIENINPGFYQLLVWGAS